MAETVASSDMGFGLAMFFGLLAVVAAGGMYVAADEQVVAGASFAAAMIAGTLAVVAVHLYGGDAG